MNSKLSCVVAYLEPNNEFKRGKAYLKVISLVFPCVLHKKFHITQFSNFV